MSCADLFVDEMISIGLAPMGSQLSCYRTDQPLNRGFPRDEPGGERMLLFVGIGSLPIVRSDRGKPDGSSGIRAIINPQLELIAVTDY